MKRTLKICLVLSLVFCIGGQIFAQDIRQDFGLWSSIGVKKKLSKKWDLSADYEYRLRDNLHQLRNTFVEIKLVRDLPKKWKTAAYIRATAEPDEFKIRFTHTVNKSFKINDFTLKYRLRHDVDRNVFQSDQNFEVRLRNRLGLQYRYKKSSLKSAFFVEINNDYESSFLFIDRLRLKGSLKYEISKDLSLELAYLTQRNYFVVEPRRDFVCVIGLSYEL